MNVHVYDGPVFYNTALLATQCSVYIARCFAVAVLGDLDHAWIISTVLRCGAAGRTFLSRRPKTW